MATIAIIGAGAMGSGIGRQLADSSKGLDLSGRPLAREPRPGQSRRNGARPLRHRRGGDRSVDRPARRSDRRRGTSGVGVERPAPVTFIDCNAISPCRCAGVAAVFRASQARTYWTARSSTCRRSRERTKTLCRR